ncbi:MAG: hypothetical protein QGH70_08460 [Nitrospinota bacterium]|jgi:hypothetical protein|nr:hypothetical protein [Nitrospinota bacterium]
MPRIPEVSLPPADPLATELFARQEEEFGFVLNTSRIYGHRPTIMRGLAQLQEGVNLSGLIGPVLKALINVRVASHNGCPF